MKRYCLILLLALLLAACTSARTLPTPVPLAILPTRVFDPTGLLVYIEMLPDEQRLVQLNTATGETTTLFTVSAPAIMTDVAALPTGEAVLVAYAPPDDSGVQRGDTELHLLPLDGSGVLLPLVTRQQSDERFLYPAWSPDGRFLAFTHVNPTTDGRFLTTLEVLDMDSGLAQVIASDAIMPAWSPDGRFLAFIALNYETETRTLVVANADGSSPRPLVGGDRLSDLAVPVFSPNGEAIYVTGAATLVAGSAQNLPADWWRIPAAGGEPVLMATLQQIGMSGEFSLDGRFLAFSGQAGIFLMHTDGSGVQLIRDVVATGGVSWLREEAP